MATKSPFLFHNLSFFFFTDNQTVMLRAILYYGNFTNALGFELSYNFNFTMLFYRNFHLNQNVQISIPHIELCRTHKNAMRYLTIFKDHYMIW